MGGVYFPHGPVSAGWPITVLSHSQALSELQWLPIATVWSLTKYKQPVKAGISDHPSLLVDFEMYINIIYWQDFWKMCGG